MSPRMIGLLFAIATAVFWGFYGPALGKARTIGESPFKPYVFIGLAYLIWGMLGGIVAVKLGGDSLKFTPESIKWGFIAGSLGAFGALTLTFAMFRAKDASLVMPVVFGGATAISAVTGLLMQKSGFHVDPRQAIGFMFVIVELCSFRNTQFTDLLRRNRNPLHNQQWRIRVRPQTTLHTNALFSQTADDDERPD